MDMLINTRACRVNKTAEHAVHMSVTRFGQ